MRTATAHQISIEAAQPKLDLGVLRELAGKTILLGVLDLGDLNVESAETVAERIRAGLPTFLPRSLIPAPDCGMKYLPREVAFGKLKALAEAPRSCGGSCRDACALPRHCELRTGLTAVPYGLGIPPRPPPLPPSSPPSSPSPP